MLNSPPMEEPDSIDVAAVLRQIREELQPASQNIHDETAHLALGVDLDELRASIAELEALRAVSAHWPIQGHTPQERGTAFVQRIVRRALQWYITPIVQQQNSFNAAVAHALHLLLESQLELTRELARLRGGLPASPPSDATD